jgi:tetratricopeptide (TPR) repeat protein
MRKSELLEELRQALWSTDLDGGVASLNKSAWRSLIDKLDDPSVETQWIAAELFDYAGQYPQAKEILSKSGPRSELALAEALRTRDPRRSVERINGRDSYKLACLVAVQWGFTFYRRNDFSEAKKTWDLCRNFVKGCLKSEDYPCHGTLSRLFYAIGLIHRQRYEYGEARKSFRESIDHAYLDAKGHNAADQGHRNELLEYRIAKCLGLGLGWVCYTEGLLDLAATLTNQSKVLLANKNVKMIRAYVDIVQAEVQISEYGDQRSHLDEAIDTLQRAYDTLTSHPAYRARTAHELALAYIRLSTLCVDAEKAQHFENARKLIAEVKEYAKGDQDRKEDMRWSSNSLVAEARLYRALGNYQDAKQTAEAALNRSKGDRFPHIDVLIELGQALMGCAQEREADEQRREDYRSAVHYFEEALTDAYENPKIQAVCHLHVARCYLRLRDGYMALEHVDKWRALKTRITNAFVHRLAKEVDREVAEFKLPFAINWPRNASEMPDVGDEETRLRGWITEVAMNLAGGTTDDAIKLIRKFKKQISKATFFAWRKDAGLSHGEN